LADDKVGARDLQQRSGGEASHAKGMADAAGCKDWDADEVTGQVLNALGYIPSGQILSHVRYKS